MIKSFNKWRKKLFSRNDITSSLEEDMIDTSEAHENNTFKKKKFVIHEEQDSAGKKREKFVVEAKSWPKQCFFCQTKGKITRTTSDKWKCTICEKTW